MERESTLTQGHMLQEKMLQFPHYGVINPIIERRPDWMSERLYLDFVDDATRHVTTIEEGWIDELEHDATEAKHKAESCRCPQCIKHAIAMEKLLDKELIRLYAPSADGRIIFEYEQ